MRDPLPPEDSAPAEPVQPGLVRPLYRTPVPAYMRVIQLVWFIAGVVDVLVGLRFVLRLFGASTASPFVSLVYGLSAPLVAPFRNIFPISGQGAYVFEPAALVALAI